MIDEKFGVAITYGQYKAMNHMEPEEICKFCNHKSGWHKASQIQKNDAGEKYIRRCYGIGCVCEGFVS